RFHLPAGEMDRGHAGFYLLHGLVAGERAEGVHEGPLVHHAPELFGAALGERVLDLYAAAQAHHVLRAVAALYALPARVVLPVLLQLLNLFFSLVHMPSGAV